MQNKTQEALAAALECDQKYISRIENGQAKPNLAICLRLANFFHVTLDFLLEGACEVQCSAALEVLVDNETAVENIKRFAAHSGYQAAAREDGADYHLTLTKK